MMKKPFSRVLCLVLSATYAFSGVALGATNADEELNQLADDLYLGIARSQPELAQLSGIKEASMDRLIDNSEQGISIRQKKEDTWLARLKRIEPSKLMTAKDKLTYVVLAEMLESHVAKRVCREELWDVEHMSGLQAIYPYMMGLQPVGTEEQRQQALKRWKQLPTVIHNDMHNLARGLRLGYSTPKSVVRLVVKQLEGLLSTGQDQSPLYSLANRTDDKTFRGQWISLVEEKIKPAFQAYLDYLKGEYLSKARTTLGVSALPDGKACYQASFREFTSLDWTPEEVHAKGKTLVAENKRRVEQLGRSLWNIGDFAGIVKHAKGLKTEYFTDAPQMVAFVENAEQRMHDKLGDYFTDLPDVPLKVVPYEDYFRGSGANDRYEPANGEHSYGVYRINTFNPQKTLKAVTEVTAFHEGYPGHHLQLSIASHAPGMHRVGKLYRNSAFMEGWARYAESLSEEMGMYQTPSAKILRLTWPGRGMVVDTGIHLMGWTRQQAVDYIDQSGRFPEGFGESLVDRIAIMPGQLTAYDSGALEIKRLRALAQARLKDKFDIRQFHRALLENGSVPVSQLEPQIKQWMNSL